MCQLEELVVHHKNKIDHTNIERVEILEKILKSDQNVGKCEHKLGAFDELPREGRSTNIDNT